VAHSLHRGKEGLIVLVCGSIRPSRRANGSALEGTGYIYARRYDIQISTLGRISDTVVIMDKDELIKDQPCKN
jgi:hypothetical protein